VTDIRPTAPRDGIGDVPADGERNFFLSGYIGMSGGLPYFARFNANPNFRSEQLNGYEAGYRRLLGRQLYFDVTAFYNQPTWKTRHRPPIFFYPRSSATV
jgi:hypothetical protein